jgi:phosphotransferase system IIB component
VRAALDAGVGTVVGVSTTHAADELVEAGAHGVVLSGNVVQVVVGPEADNLAEDIEDLM